MKKLAIKLCGFTNKETVDLAVRCKANFIGFVFYPPSRRFISATKAAQIATDMPKNVKKVAVVVNPEDDDLEQIIQNLKPDFLQLHETDFGRTVEIKNKFKTPIIKAFALTKAEDLQQLKQYDEVADYFLFDAKNKEVGGAGRVFDWNILKDLNTKKEWFLSGGLNAGNIKKALKETGAKMIDLSSGIEEVKGVKSPALIVSLMSKLVMN